MYIMILYCTYDFVDKNIIICIYKFKEYFNSYVQKYVLYIF